MHRLKYDDNFIPCQTVENDEIFRNGFFHFNITQMFNYLESVDSNVALSEVNVSQFYKEFSTINEDHVESVDLDRPLILAEISPKRYNLIDGNHRVNKAQKIGVNTLPCYHIDAPLHLQFLTSKEAYAAYVNYWNGKIEELEQDTHSIETLAKLKYKN